MKYFLSVLFDVKYILEKPKVIILLIQNLSGFELAVRNSQFVKHFGSL